MEQRNMILFMSCKPAGYVYREALAFPRQYLGWMVMPLRYPKDPEILRGWEWSSDNGVFMLRDKFNIDDYCRYLEMLRTTYPPGCRFVVAPDSVGNSAETNRLWDKYAERVRAFGFPVAYALQDGQNELPPFNFDAIFIGGGDDYKLSPTVTRLVGKAKTLGKWVHMGRVNGRPRIKHALVIGCDSIDGTAFCRIPENDLRQRWAWLIALHQERLNL